MMKNEPKYKTREEWLNAAVTAMTPLFEAKERKVPLIRVSVGWPSRNALSKKKRAIGQCWATTCSADGVTEIFISPWLHEVDKPCSVLDTLLHEMVHAVVGVEHGHKKPFGTLARALGLEGKLTATFAGQELLEQLEGIAKDLGVYPHAKLDLTKSGVKKQTTRMIKVECLCDDGDGTCGFKVRASKSALLEIGIPACPKHKTQMFADIPEGEKDDA